MRPAERPSLAVALMLFVCVAWLPVTKVTVSARDTSRQAPPQVFVLLWFDTEDYLLESDDDATLRLAEFLTAEGIRATFKLVGEKARVLERRGRSDVIAALGRHDIGYHTDFHSVHPTPAEYLSALGWDEGIAEFVRREGPGVADIQRIFGVTASSYGQPGSSWGPQAAGAMRRLGIKMYLDSGRHVGLDRKPHYYGGVLTLYDLAHERRAGLKAPADLDAAKTAFSASRAALAAEGGGVVSIYYHPNEWVMSEFWDAVNFARGANPPRSEWKRPGESTAAERAIAWRNFEEYVRFMKSFPDVRFVTASDALRLYADRAIGRTLTRDEVTAIASAIDSPVSFVTRGDYTLSLSEVLALLVQEYRGGPTVVADTTLDGPTEPGPAFASPTAVSGSQFSRAVEDVAAYLAAHKRVPSTVWLGSLAVPPEAFLVALARQVAGGHGASATTGTVAIPVATLGAARHVQDDNPGLWGWIIFPPGFRAPAMMALAKRQTWTLKPAILDKTAVR